VKVTALKLQARNKTRVNVYLDGEFGFGLVKSEAVRLRIGQELSAVDIERLKDADARELAFQRALRLIDLRPRSADEIRQNLARHKVAEGHIQAALERLAQSGLINDASFARMWVENQAAFRPRSKRALTQELRRKGIDQAEITAAVTEVDDRASAQVVAAARAKRHADLPWPEFRLKLGGFLARRGFDYETAREAIEQAWHGLHGQAPREVDLDS
jgi:regulatory protein